MEARVEVEALVDAGIEVNYEESHRTSTGGLCRSKTGKGYFHLKKPQYQQDPNVQNKGGVEVGVEAQVEVGIEAQVEVGVEVQVEAIG